jgi:hypothetical protein
MDPSDRRWLLAVPLACAACTFTGLGNYDVKTCTRPAGTTATVQQVGAEIASAALTFANVSGSAPIGAFSSIRSNCAQAVGSGGYVGSPSCTFFFDLAPVQPWVVPLGGGYAAAAVTTAAPCSAGQVAFEFAAGATTDARVACGQGAALPSLTPLSSEGSTALLLWYGVPYMQRQDPVQSCAAAVAAPLLAAVIQGASTQNPSIGTPVTLTSASTSVRPAAVAQVPGQVVAAAPDGNAVTVWSFAGGLSNPATAAVPGLIGSRAASVAVAADGSNRIAVVAEIGCTPQAIALSVGTIAGGFGPATVVAPASTKPLVQPTVAWVASEGDWIVGWISSNGGAHVLAQRFDANGNPVGSTVDPSTAASGASVAGDGSLLAYVPDSNSFVSASLGCGE